jgi:hypothetical protein
MYEIKAHCPIHGEFTVLRKTLPRTNVIICAYQYSISYTQKSACIESALIIHTRRLPDTDKPQS